MRSNQRRFEVHSGDSQPLLVEAFRFMNTLQFKTFTLMFLLAASAGVPAFAAGLGRDVRGLAPSLTVADTPAKPPAPDGYLQRWLLLEPIRVPIRSNQQLTDSYVQANLKKEYFPGQFSVVPRDGDKVTVGSDELAWHAVDTSVYNVNLYNFAYSLNKTTFNVLFWAVTIINCPEEIPNVRLSVGSNAASIWWFNGQEIIGIYGDRHMVKDDGVSKRLTLKKGPNVLRCAVINAPGVSSFCARFLDEEGKPVTGFTLSTVSGSN
jgi:hypothetical protein